MHLLAIPNFLLRVNNCNLGDDKIKDESKTKNAAPEFRYTGRKDNNSCCSTDVLYRNKKG